MEGQRRWKEGRERRGMDAVIFGVYHITEPVRGLISSPLARQDGVKSWISRPICTPPPPSSSFPFARLFFSFPRSFRPLLNRWSVENAQSGPSLFLSPPLFSPFVLFSTRREIVRVLLRNVNAEPLTLSGLP